MRTKLSHFNFELPKELIAQYPAENRDESRLMVVHRDTGKIEHKIFKEVIEYFDEDDTFISTFRKYELNPRSVRYCWKLSRLLICL